MLNNQELLEMRLVALGQKPAGLLEFACADATTGRAKLRELFRSEGIGYVHSSLAGADAQELPVISVAYAQTPAAVKSLIDECGARDFASIGKALGYPPSAIDAYCRIENPTRAWNIWMQLVDARNAGHEIPSWFGYLSHVPSSMNLIRGDVCPESEMLGRRYQRAIRAHFPQFAEQIEAAARFEIPSAYQRTAGKVTFSWDYLRDVEVTN